MDYAALRNFVFEDRAHAYTRKDAMLYALGIGLGADPLDPRQLAFVYERQLQALPTMGVVLANASPWLARPELGIAWRQVVHGEHELELHRPLPPERTVLGATRIDGVVDKGPGKGALIYLGRDVFEVGNAAPLLSVRQTLFCRGDGGFGGPTSPVRLPFILPLSAPDLAVDLATLPQAALIYRLSGDMNPLHADLQAARLASFERPILHGLCTFGVAGHALLKGVFDYAPERLHTMRARFSAPVYPGETLRTEIWNLGQGAYGFRCRVLERDVVVLDNGHAAARA